MSIFDTLAENRYQKWLTERASPHYQPPEPVSRTAHRTSFEGQLFQQVLALLEKAAAIPLSEQGARTSRNALLAQADALAFQLQISLEKKNLSLVAATLAASIRQKRSEIT